MIEPELLTFDEAARRLTLSRRTVERLVAARQLESIVVGRKLRRIRTSELAAYLERQALRDRMARGG